MALRRGRLISVLAIVFAVAASACGADSAVSAPGAPGTSQPAPTTSQRPPTTTRSATATTTAATAGKPILAPIPPGIVPQLTPADVDLTGRQQYVDAISAGNNGELLVVRVRSLTVVDKTGQSMVISPELTDTGKILSASGNDAVYSLLIKTGD